MNILNTIRIGLSVVLLTLSYLCVIFSGVFIILGFKIASLEYEPLGWSNLWTYYKEKIESVKVNLL